MENQQELLILGLMTKYNYINNINIIDINKSAQRVLGDRRSLFSCALFWRKERSNEYTHVMLYIGVESGMFEIYVGRSDKSYLSMDAHHVLKIYNTNGACAVEALNNVFALKRHSEPVYHTPTANPGERVVSSVHGFISNFINIVTR